MKYIGFDISNSKMTNIELYDRETEIMTSISRGIQPLQMTFDAFDFQFDYLLEITDEQYHNFLNNGIPHTDNYKRFMQNNNFYQYMI
jgi:hypothetical protein